MNYIYCIGIHYKGDLCIAYANEVNVIRVEYNAGGVTTCKLQAQVVSVW